MNTLKHKGFTGHFLYNEKAEKFFGQLINSNELVVFQGATIEILKIDFIHETEMYINNCKNQGKSPYKRYSGTFNVRVPVELHRRIETLATKQGINLNEFVKRALISAVKGR